MNSILQFAANNRRAIIRLFQVVYLGSIAFLAVAAAAIASDHPVAPALLMIGRNAGVASLILFLVVTLPGILGRFGVKHWLITLGIMFRRHTGISTFLLALIHAQLIYFFPTFLGGGAVTFPPPLYIAFGSFGLYSLTALAATSNDWSVRKLGRHWKNLHKLVYLIFWFIFGHVAIQGENLWTILIGAAGVLELASLVYARQRRHNLPENLTGSASEGGDV